jgi:hypothetical protein
MFFVFLRGGRKNRSHEIRKYKNAGGHKAAPLQKQSMPVLFVYYFIDIFLKDVSCE